MPITVADLETKLSRRPNSPLFARLADEYLAVGRLNEAKELCRSGLARYPNYTTALIVLAKCFEFEQDYTNAIKSLQQVLEIAPHHSLAQALFIEYRDRLLRQPLLVEEVPDTGEYEEPDEPIEVMTDTGAGQEATEPGEPAGDADSGTYISPDTEISDAVINAIPHFVGSPEAGGATAVEDTGEPGTDASAELPVSGAEIAAEAPADESFEPSAPPETQLQAEQETDTESLAGSVIEPLPELTTEPLPESATEPVSESAPEPFLESTHEPVIEPTPEPLIASEPEPLTASVPGPSADNSEQIDEEAERAEWSVPEHRETEPAGEIAGTAEEQVFGTGEEHVPADGDPVIPLSETSEPDLAPPLPDNLPAGSGSRIVSKTLAEIYAKQGAYDEAILTYRLLQQERPQHRQEWEDRIRELQGRIQARPAT